MNPAKIIKIIENKEWNRLKAIAEFEMKIKQIGLDKFMED